jgi:opacity protein-like surface antigen
MKTLLAAAAAVSLLAIAAPASAGVYGSLGYSNFDADEQDFDALTGRLGWGGDDKWYGAEAELSVGLGEERDLGPPIVDKSITSNIAAYAVAHFDVAESFTVYGRVGYSVLRVEQDPGIDFSADGPAYGAGVQFNFGEKDGIRLDYTYHDFDTDLNTHVNVYSVSWVRRFR